MSPMFKAMACLWSLGRLRAAPWSDIARRSHANGRHRKQHRRNALGGSDARPRASLVGFPDAQASDRASADGALNTGGNQRSERADCQDLFGRAECTGMDQVPEIAASQNGDDRRSHLRAKKLLAADATGSCQCEAGARPEHGSQNMEG